MRILKVERRVWALGLFSVEHLTDRALEEQEATRILRIPSGLRPAPLIMAGYAAEAAAPSNVKHLNEIIHNWFY